MPTDHRRNSLIETGAIDLARLRELAALLPMWPAELADQSAAGQLRICKMLMSALRRERQRGVGGHWSYNIVRHAALVRILPDELGRLAALATAQKRPAISASLHRSGAA